MERKVETNVNLAPFTTFKIGGEAKYLIRIKNKKDLIEAFRFIKKRKIPYFILGAGSNILFPDQGFDGVVIKMENDKLKIEDNIVEAESGVRFRDLLDRLTEEGLSGLEWGKGIKSTIGGAVRGNAGAFGTCMEEITEKVTALNIDTLKTEEFNKKECEFDYRESIFKNNSNLVILKVILELKKDSPEAIKKRMNKYLQKRKERHPLGYPSAGSTFKNHTERPAGEYIEKAGFKGKKIGGVEVSQKHANFIINTGDGKAKDVKKLIKLIKEKVNKQFNIQLEEEINIIHNKKL